MLLDALTTSPSAFADRTGWTARPEGLCKGDRCVPVNNVVLADGDIDVEVAAAGLGMPIVHDVATGTFAIGPESGGSTLTTVELPDITLPDVDGNPFRLRSLHGRKVLLVAWASW